MSKIDDNKLLRKVIDMSLADKQNVALNIRKNGKLERRQITKNIDISSKPDGSGIDIFVRDNAKNVFVLVPVIITESGLTDVVYNDFHIGKNSNVIVMAGCAIENPGKKDSHHRGIHRFFVKSGAKVEYNEQHFADDHDKGLSVLDPVTEITLESNSSMTINTTQIEGVDKTKRTTIAKIADNSTLIIKEKIMTHASQFAETKFGIKLNGKNSSTHIVSRSVATENSKQAFESKLEGNNECYGHVECDAIIKENGKVRAIPEITANHKDARLIHEATIGKIAGEQFMKLMTLGLSKSEAEMEIIKGFLK